MDPIRIMVVDDTILYRKVIGDVIASIPGAEVCGTAANGRFALTKINTFKPDLITLDIEMPEMNGLELLEQLKKTGTKLPRIIMLSTLTTKGGDMTIRALELGAFDFITKPQSGTAAENMEKIRAQLTPAITSLIQEKKFRSRLSNTRATLARTVLPRESKEKKTVIPVTPPPRRIPRTVSRPSEVVAIGISTGGPNALAAMLPKLPADIGVPLLIVQHMPPVFTKSLAGSLNNKCAIEVKEAEDGDLLKPGLALIAPGGKQMRVEAHRDGIHRLVRITDDPPENSCRPSVDYLFRSIAGHYVGRATGIIMTGMGQDGFKGLQKMHENGAVILAQDEASCTVYGMPKAPAEAGITDKVVPLSEMARALINTLK
ncbi:chemotaxis response regulator protein-glutamate methylesterase [Desulfoluna sp.]|uniref:protein-glutamate methylesterase/protein-glutamine glutaminase n=1 Tax=Desulfoluna sp. TaxID=2045199 RepID=UPI0026375CDF|nr:chemotaxis response regulator protein-glutamate methylesterase [Desulfoluna sp.]